MWVAVLVVVTVSMVGSCLGAPAMWPLRCSALPYESNPLRGQLFATQPLENTDLLRCTTCEDQLCSCLTAAKGPPIPGSTNGTVNITIDVPPQLARCATLDALLTATCNVGGARSASTVCVEAFVDCKLQLAVNLTESVTLNSSSWCATWARSLQLARINNELYMGDLWRANGGTLPASYEAFNTTLADSCLHTACSVFSALSDNSLSGCTEDDYNVTRVCAYTGPFPTEEPTTPPPSPTPTPAPGFDLRVTVSVPVALGTVGVVPGQSSAAILSSAYATRAAAVFTRLLRSSLSTSFAVTQLPSTVTARQLLELLNASATASNDDVSVSMSLVSVTGNLAVMGVTINATGGSPPDRTLLAATLSGWVMSSASAPQVLRSIGITGAVDSPIGDPDQGAPVIDSIASSDDASGVPIWGFFLAVLGSCIVGVVLGFVVAKYVLSSPEALSLRQRILQEPILGDLDDS